MKDVFEEFKVLETERFVLREIKESDYKYIFETYTNEEAIKYQPIKVIKSIEEAKKYFQFIKNGFKEKRFVRWCITRKENDELLGLIAIHSVDNSNQSCSIGFMLNKKHWGKGIMTEAAKEVIKFIFKEIKMNRIDAQVHPENQNSLKLCEKLGFELKGILKNKCLNRRTNQYEDRNILELINKELN